MFLLVPAYPGCPGQTAVKWLLLLLLLLSGTRVPIDIAHSAYPIATSLVNVPLYSSECNN